MARQGVVEAARQKGKAEGRLEGKAEGRLEGKAEGRQECNAEQRQRIITYLFNSYKKDKMINLCGVLEGEVTRKEITDALKMLKVRGRSVHFHRR